jgi:hypothetical protein
MPNYYSLRGLKIFESLPLTFHIYTATDDPEYKVFYNYCCRLELEERKKKGGSKRIGG